jgi:hypothetical protein
LGLFASRAKKLHAGDACGPRAAHPWHKALNKLFPRASPDIGLFGKELHIEHVFNKKNDSCSIQFNLFYASTSTSTSTSTFFSTTMSSNESFK